MCACVIHLCLLLYFTSGRRILCCLLVQGILQQWCRCLETFGEADMRGGDPSCRCCRWWSLCIHGENQVSMAAGGPLLESSAWNQSASRMVNFCWAHGFPTSKFHLCVGRFAMSNTLCKCSQASFSLRTQAKFALHLTLTSMVCKNCTSLVSMPHSKLLLNRWQMSKRAPWSTNQR